LFLVFPIGDFPEKPCCFRFIFFLFFPYLQEADRPYTSMPKLSTTFFPMSPSPNVFSTMVLPFFTHTSLPLTNLAVRLREREIQSNPFSPACSCPYKRPLISSRFLIRCQLLRRFFPALCTFFPGLASSFSIPSHSAITGASVFFCCCIPARILFFSDAD